MSSGTEDLFKRLLCNTNKIAPFPDTLKKFAVTLHFYSPKAYEYVRSIFINNLPRSMTINKWYRSVKSKSGINKISIEAVKRKVKQEKLKNGNKPILCNMVQDEMKVKKQIDLMYGEEYGYIC